MIKKSSFNAAWWLPGPHLQTIWGVTNRKLPEITCYRERVELPDGDFIDLDWTHPPHQQPTALPLVLIIHGLGGSVESHYAKGILSALKNNHWRGVFMHFRGCSGEPNRLPRSYHSGETGDLHFIIQHVLKKEHYRPFNAVGYSLGGNMLLKWLGEQKDNSPLTTAVAVSVPFELHKAANRLLCGFSQLYQWWILRQLRSYLQNKFAIIPAPIDISAVDNLRTFWEFDTYITAPLHGFRNADDYYRQSSCRSYLKLITTPTLILHALDDPFLSHDAIPSEKELSPQVVLELSPHGGHVGFVAGTIPGKPIYWLEERILQHLHTIVQPPRTIDNSTMLAEIR